MPSDGTSPPLSSHRNVTHPCCCAGALGLRSRRSRRSRRSLSLSRIVKSQYATACFSSSPLDLWGTFLQGVTSFSFLTKKRFNTVHSDTRHVHQETPSVRNDAKRLWRLLRSILGNVGNHLKQVHITVLSFMVGYVFKTGELSVFLSFGQRF